MKMTAKYKANELANRFVTKSVFDMTNEELKEQRILAKRNAIICVNEIIDAIDWHEFETPNKEINYWLDVRKELYKL